jgi:hypothetical protein
MNLFIHLFIFIYLFVIEIVIRIIKPTSLRWVGHIVVKNKGIKVKNVDNIKTNG